MKKDGVLDYSSGEHNTKLPMTTEELAEWITKNLEERGCVQFAEDDTN